MKKLFYTVLANVFLILSICPTSVLAEECSSFEDGRWFHSFEDTYISSTGTCTFGAFTKTPINQSNIPFTASGFGDKFPNDWVDGGFNTPIMPSSITTTNATISNNLTVDNDLAVGNDLTVSGDGTFTGALSDNPVSDIRAVSAKSANYTATSSDTLILADTTSASFTITLPASSGITGKVYLIKKTDSGNNTVTVDGNISETIDGSTTYRIAAQYDSIEIISDGTNWVLVTERKTKPSFNVNLNGIAQEDIVTSTATKIIWTAEEFDTNDNFANDRFTPSIAGKYLITGTVGIITLADQKVVQVFLYKNGSVYKVLGISAQSGTDTLIASGSVVATANGSSDYFELYVFHTNGSNRNVVGGASFTYFSGCKID